MSAVNNFVSPDESQRLSLPARPRSAGVARGAVGDWVAQGWPDSAADVRQVVTELVAHLSRDDTEDSWLDVAWSLDESVGPGGQGVHVTVSDLRAPRSGVLRTVRPTLAGRRRMIVEALSQRWWVEALGGRETLHAVLALT